VYSLRPDGSFKVLHTFTATDPTTRANRDGATPDFCVVLSEDDSIIGAADFGGNGSSACFLNSGGTLYQLEVDKPQGRHQ